MRVPARAPQRFKGFTGFQGFVFKVLFKVSSQGFIRCIQGHNILLESVFYELLTISPDPDPREDLESRSPNLGPYTTKGTL